MIGTILGGRYEILELVGTGGMSYVYKAKCRLLNRFVAVKILKEEYNNDTEFVSKFYIESQAAASLSNVNIVSVYDVGEENGLKYIVMEHVEGITLKDIIKKNRILDWNVAVNCTLQILNALECAHKNGIVHRDIKPHNILVTNDGVLKVADFGIAKALNSSETKKIDNSVVGSVHYISPEQAKGIMIDARSDLYSLGIVMYEMLTGKLPFEGENPVSVALMHLNSEPTPIKDINIAVPLELSIIVKKAMSRDISLRYQNAKEMAHDLVEFKKREKAHSFTTNYEVDELTQNSLKVSDDIKIDSNVYNNSDEEKNFETKVGDIKIKEEPHTSFEEKTVYSSENKNAVKGGEVRMPQNNRKKITNEEKKAVYAAIAVSAVIIVVLFAIFMKIFFKDVNLFESFKGKEFYLEDYTGKDFSEVEEIFKENNVKYKVESYEENNTYDDNVVLNQTPAGDMTIKLRGTTVKLIVNDTDGSNIGKEDENDAEKIRVPSVIGQEYRQAEKKITALKLECVIKEEESEDVSEGYVIRQTPDAGTKLEQGKTVTVFVSKSSESDTIRVEKFVGMTEEKAKDLAKELGLEVVIETEETTKSKAGTVLSQSIATGTEVAKDTTITLFVGVYTEQEYQDAPIENPSNETMREIAVDLPDTGSQNIVTVFKDGVQISSRTYPATEKKAIVSVMGSGSVHVEIKVNGNVSYSKTVSFN